MDAIKRIRSSRRIIIKIGSALLVDNTNGLIRRDWLSKLTADIYWLSEQGSCPLIVSSGSIALGRAPLQLKGGTLSLEQSQAAAAVGQIRLARAYEEFLAPHNLVAAQILLTLEDSHNRRRYLNSRATFENLLARRVVPIVNENDTVATDEIRFGDNDRLAAQVAAMTNADCMVLLSDVDGLYDSDPNKNATSRHFPVISSITPEIESMASASESEIAKGGMRTKIQAAKTAASAGCATIIANGKVNAPISSLVGGANCTLFEPQGDPQSARKHWIASMKPMGRLIIDQGALAALKNGKSLLAAGVVHVTGDFGRGDPIEICGFDDVAVGIGLTRYTSNETQKILGCKSTEVTKILGYPTRAALIHRDDFTALTLGFS